MNFLSENKSKEVKWNTNTNNSTLLEVLYKPLEELLLPFFGFHYQQALPSSNNLWKFADEILKINFLNTNSGHKKKRVILSVINDLVTDQRVHRIANSLHCNNYNVLVVGRKMKHSKSIYREYDTKRFRFLFNKGAIFYIEYNIRIFFFLLFAKADIYLSNDTDTLVANFWASRIRRKKLVFDAHEMFSEMPELKDRPFVRNIWIKVEDCIFPKLKTSYTVCRSIADVYTKKYGINMQVVRNISAYKPCENEQKKLSVPGKKILLYQGSVNIGRGIEWIIDAMPYIDNAIFYIAGDGDILQQLKSYVKSKNLNEKVIFLGKIPFHDLHAYTISADLGISLLEKIGLNYYYSLPNRIFDFMHAKVPVIATDFPEIRNIITETGIGCLVNNYQPKVLAKTIQSVLAEWDQKPDKEAIFANACKEFNWEKEEAVLLNIFSQVK